MSSALLSVKVEIAKLPQASADRILASTELRQALDIVAEDLVAAVVDRFQSSGDGDWPALKYPPGHRRYGGKMMIDTSNLMGSIAAEVGPDSAAATTGVSYVVFHLDGGPIVPKRNPFELREDIWEEEADIVAQALAVATARELAGVP